jgi:hypothetical protein
MEVSMFKSDTQEIQEMCMGLRNNLYTHLHVWHSYDEIVRDDLQRQFVERVHKIEETLLKLAEDRATAREVCDQTKIRFQQQEEIVKHQGEVIDSLQTVVAEVAHLAWKGIEMPSWERLEKIRGKVGVKE